MAETPEFIGKYPIIGLLAKGGMGAVYKAVHPTLKRPVVLKKLTVKGNPQFIERFKREARIMMDFKHDGIVTVYDHFKEGTSYFIVQEFVDGFSLEELIRRERAVPSLPAMRIFLDICRALKYAHDSGVIHRDIKPANVLLARDGTVKLADFGIASYEGEDREQSLTGQGMTLGTPSYMPPEQFEDTRHVDKCADIYAMGVVLYEMVTGKKPFPGNFAPDTINMIQKGRYIRVRRMNPTVDPVIARLVGRMIRPKKSQRFQDLAPVIRILERRLSREDGPEIERHIACMMTGKPFQARRRKSRVVRRVLAVAIPLILLASPPVAWFFASGTWHEWFDPTDWGSFAVTVSRPAPALSAAEGATERLPLTVELFTDSGGAVERVESLELPGLLRRGARALSGIFPGLSSWAQDRTDKVYAKPGFYRLKIQSGNKLLWDSFYLPPLPELRRQGRDGGLDLSYRLSEPLPKPVTFSFSFSDERLGKDLSAETAVDIADLSGSWVPLASVPADSLLSGRVYRFRASAPGYFSKVFSLRVDPGQTELSIQAALAGLTGGLRVTTDLPSLSFQIDGRDRVVSGGEERSYAALRASRGKPLDLQLPPGRITLSFGGGAQGAEAPVDLQAGSRVLVSANATADGRGVVVSVGTY